MHLSVSSNDETNNFSISNTISFTYMICCSTSLYLSHLIPSLISTGLVRLGAFLVVYEGSPHAAHFRKIIEYMNNEERQQTPDSVADWFTFAYLC